MVCSSFLQVAPEGAAGLSLRLDGFSHKLPALAEAVFSTLTTLKVLAHVPAPELPDPPHLLQGYAVHMHPVPGTQRVDTFQPASPSKAHDIQFQAACMCGGTRWSE